MISIECKNPSVAEHIMYFLNSLPKNDVTVTVSDNNFYSQKQKKELLKRVNEIKSGKAKTLTHKQVFADVL